VRYIEDQAAKPAKRAPAKRSTAKRGTTRRRG
jgi:hypothetical protein